MTKHIRLYTYYIRYNKFYKEYLTYINTHKPTQDNLTTDIILNSQGGWPDLRNRIKKEDLLSCAGWRLKAIVTLNYDRVRIKVETCFYVGWSLLICSLAHLLNIRSRRVVLFEEADYKQKIQRINQNINLGTNLGEQRNRPVFPSSHTQVKKQPSVHLWPCWYRLLLYIHPPVNHKYS